MLAFTFGYGIMILIIFLIATINFIYPIETIIIFILELIAVIILYILCFVVMLTIVSEKSFKDLYCCKKEDLIE